MKDLHISSALRAHSSAFKNVLTPESNLVSGIDPLGCRLVVSQNRVRSPVHHEDKHGLIPYCRDLRNRRWICRTSRGESRRFEMAINLPPNVLHPPPNETGRSSHTSHKSPGSGGRDNECKYTIRRKAMRRFFHGCPPRKNGDNSFGDAFHWEWMLDCAVRENAELVIVSRDSDFGVQLDGHSYVNDHLRHEFSQRVSKKRKLLLYSRLAEALKHFAVHVTRDEEAEEEAMIRSAT